MEDNILLIGLGPHARHYHFLIVNLLLENHSVEISAIVDLESQRKSVCEYAIKQGFDCNNIFFVEDKHRNSEYISDDDRMLLNNIVSKYSITRVIISTEPKVHKAYALWAADCKLSVLIDKPITAPEMEVFSKNSALKIRNDYDEIVSRLSANSTSSTILALRRYLPVILATQNYLKTFINEFKLPITHIAIRHGEGMWNMPDEFFTRENHPYKYGYGLLLHSGYHFIDLFLFFLRLNNVLMDKRTEKIEYCSTFTTPRDLSSIIKCEDYQRIFQHDFSDFYTPKRQVELSGFGEVDYHALFNMKKDGNIITTGILDLLQTSYCTRFKPYLPEDTYKNNGRTTHEYISIEVAHLLRLIIERTDLGSVNENSEKYDKGNNYTLRIYRNSNLVGGVPYESLFFGDSIDITLGDDVYRLNSAKGARLACIYDWLYGKEKQSLIESHRDTINLLSSIYQSMFASRSMGKNIAIGESLWYNF